MHAILEQIYATRTVARPDGGAAPVFPTGTRPEDAAWLTQIVGACGARRTLEIGMAYGLSSVAILDGLGAAGEHHVVDPFQRDKFHGIGLHTVERAGLGHRLVLHEEPSQFVLPRLAAAGERFDFVFHDGSHLFDVLMADLVALDAMLPVGGLLAIDDLWMPAVRRALSFVLRNWDYQAVPTGVRPALVQRLAKPVLRLAGDPRPFAARAVVLHAAKVMLLRKTGPSKRRWNHFRPF